MLTRIKQNKLFNTTTSIMNKNVPTTNMKDLKLNFYKSKNIIYVGFIGRWNKKSGKNNN